jgi:putative hydrolase of the HAD superfamily
MQQAPHIIAAVLFDLDETLFDRTNSLIKFLEDQHLRFRDRLGVTGFEAWRDKFVALDKRGHVPKSVVYPDILASFGGDATVAGELLADYRDRCWKYARAFPGVVETLALIRLRGLAIGIVTNGATESQARTIESLGLSKLVDVVLISESEGVRKPEMAIFARAAKRLNVQISRCLFIGDNPVADILGAHAAGMKTAWFSNGMIWPSDLEPSPGRTIGALSEVLGLIDQDQRWE